MLLSRIRYTLLIGLVLVSLSLVAIQPFLQGKMPLTDDGTLHLYRTIALDYSLTHDGSFYPRYSSALVYGYGSPLFNYFPPTAYYIPVLLHRMGLTYVQAWLTTMVLFTWLAMFGAYLLSSKWTNYWGGLIGAMAYVYSPYLLYDSVSRGTITEYAALAVLPLVLYAFTRLAEIPSIRRVVSTSLCFAFFIPLHNIVTLHGTVFLSAYCLFLFFHFGKSRKVFLALFSAGLIGFLLTTFFWLPALGETQFVKINAITDALPSLDVTTHLRSLDKVLAFPAPIDNKQQQAIIPITVSWIGLILGLFALGFTLIWNTRLKWFVGFLVLTVITLVVMNLEISAWLWKHLPLLKYTQFAWRTLGIASLALAVLCAIGVTLGVSRLTSKIAQNTVYGFFLILIGMYSWSWTYRPYSDLNPQSVVDAQNHERSSGELSLSSYSEYLPIWNTSSLDSNKLVGRWNGSLPIARFLSNEFVTILEEDWTGTTGLLNVLVSQPSSIVFDWLYMPSWIAKIDGVTARNFPTESEGLVQIEISAGKHSVEIALGTTPLQDLSVGISSVTLIFGCLLVVVSFWRRRIKSTSEWLPSATVAQVFQFSEWLPSATVVALGVLLLVVKTNVIDTTTNIFHVQRFDGESIAQTNPNKINFNREIELIGIDQPYSVETGKKLPFKAFWRLLSPEATATDYSSKYTLRDSAGNLVSEVGSFQPGGVATSNWLPGYYVQEVLEMEIPPHTPPGIYSVEVTLFDAQSLVPANVINADGNPVDAKKKVFDITITAPSESDSVATRPQTDIDLRSFEGVPTLGQSGSEFTLALDWQSGSEKLPDLQYRLVWQRNAQTVWSSSAVPLITDYPTSVWRIGETWTGRQRWYIPAELSGGTYQVLAEVVDPQLNSIGQFTLGNVVVETPLRVFETPSFATRSNVEWENGLVLVGYTYNPESVALSLVWKTRKPLDQSVHLFVHVVDSAGKIIAQTDGIPMDWTRPTTSWSTDEFIVTHHLFAGSPSGNYQLQIGWYDPQTTTRNALVDGTDTLVLENAIDIP